MACGHFWSLGRGLFRRQVGGRDRSLTACRARVLSCSWIVDNSTIHPPPRERPARTDAARINGRFPRHGAMPHGTQRSRSRAVPIRAVAAQFVNGS
jgi:hypothetical protein